MSKPSTRDAPRRAASNAKPPQLHATSSTVRPSRLPPYSPTRVGNPCCTSVCTRVCCPPPPGSSGMSVRRPYGRAMSWWKGLRRSSSCRSSASSIGRESPSPCIGWTLDPPEGISSIQDEHRPECSAILPLDRQRRGGGTTSDILDGLSLLGSDGHDAHLLRLGHLALAAVHRLHRHLR